MNGCIHAIPHHTIAKEVERRAQMVVTRDATLQAGKEFDDIVERTFDIVVELITPRTGMHDDDRTVERCRVFMELLLHVVEVGHRRHVIVLRGVGIETDKLDTSGNE